MDLGDRSDGDSYSIGRLQSALVWHPLSGKFIVTWKYTVAMGEDDYRVVYDRRSGTLTYAIGGRGKPFKNIYEFSGVTDQVLHQADSYLGLEDYGCQHRKVSSSLQTSPKSRSPPYIIPFI